MRIPSPSTPGRPAGFTVVELLISASVMMVAVAGALAIYARSNKVSVEQQMLTEIQNDVRASMFFITRDLRMAGCGLPEEFSFAFVEGWDNEDQSGDVEPDRVRLMGNMDDPLNLGIQNYQGSSVNLSLDDFSFEQYPYPDEFYDDQFVLVVPNPDSGCRSVEVRRVTHVTHSSGGNNERLNFSPGLAPGVNPPGGLSGTCMTPDPHHEGEMIPNPDAYDGGTVCFINVKEYWLDSTGDIDGLNAGVNGYIGGGEAGRGILYCTHNGVHMPLARNIENFQVEYNGDMNADGELDGWSPWDTAWGPDQVARIQHARIWILGRSPRPFTSVGGKRPDNLDIYRRPLISNSPAAADDRHKRFLMDSTSNIRNMSLNLYNIGQR